MSKYYDSLHLKFGPTEETLEEERILELTESTWLRLEQKEIPEREQTAGLVDAFEMVQMAQSGMTAFNYDLPDGVEIVGNNIEITLDFYVWPSNLDLTYSLSGPDNMVISTASAISESKSANIIFPLQRYTESPYPGTLGAASWETPCYNELGEEVDPPLEQYMEKGYVIIGKKVFGVMRANINAQGFLHTAKLTFEKTETKRDSIAGIFYNQVNHKSIKNPECTIHATWIDNEGNEQTESLNLILPKYVLDILEACPDGALKRDYVCGDPNESATVTHTTVYYSLCTGEVLDTIQKEIENPC